MARLIGELLLFLGLVGAAFLIRSVGDRRRRLIYGPSIVEIASRPRGIVHGPAVVVDGEHCTSCCNIPINTLPSHDVFAGALSGIFTTCPQSKGHQLWQP